jgi:aminopeptidase N
MKHDTSPCCSPHLDDEQNPSYMLPDTVTPLHYELNICCEQVLSSEVDGTPLETEDEDGNCGVLQGKTKIFARTKKTVSSIVMHAVDLTFQQATCYTISYELPFDERTFIKERMIPIVDIVFYKEKQTVELMLNESIESNTNILLYFEYKTYIHSRNFRGIYACKFNKYPPNKKPHSENSSSCTVNGFVTHFEPCDARRAFPCFDEPATKATFQLQLTVPAHLNALSNTPLIRQENVEIVSGSNGMILQMKKFTFAKTPKMSAYLIAWFVGLFDYIEEFVELKHNSSLNGFNSISSSRLMPIRVYTPIGMAEYGRFALKVAIDAVKLYSEKFNSPFCMPKLDLVGVSILDALAMENFGLLVFREKYLLVNERTSIRLKQRIARLICHEIGHQWFGNLVSIKWWKYLWLKEGFARFLEYALVTTFFPHWNYWTHFASDIYVRALEMDEESFTHPVECRVTNVAEIQTIFDSISYGKGASIFRMLIHFIGEDIMWKGLEHFLHTHQFAHARTEDLWNSFSFVSKLDVSDLMDSWVKFSGHPVVVVSEIMDGTNVSTNKFLVEQYLCTKNGTTDITNTKVIDPETGYCEYNIPIRIKSNHDTKVHSAIMKKSSAVLELPFEISMINACSWIKFNYGHTGFYRVNYSPALWKKLADAVARNELSVEDSLGLLLDAFALIKLPNTHKAHMSIDTLFYLLISFRKCTDYQIWLYITQQLQSLLPLMDEQVYIAKMKLFVCELYSDISKRIDLFNSNNFTIIFLEHKAHDVHESLDEQLSGDYLKSLIINLLSMCDHKATIDLCLHHFKEHIAPLKDKDDSDLLSILKRFNMDNLVSSLAVAIKQGSKFEYSVATKIFHATKSETELQKQFFRVLWESQHAELIQEAIYILFNCSEVIDDYIYSAGSTISRNAVARKEVWSEIINIATREVERYRNLRNNISPPVFQSKQDKLRNSRHPMFYPMTVSLLSHLKFNCGNLQFLQDHLMLEIDILRHFINEKGLSAMLHTVHQNCKWVFGNAAIISNYLQQFV